MSEVLELRGRGTLNRRKPVPAGFDRNRDYTPTQAAQIVQIARSTVHRACREERLPSRRVPYGDKHVTFIRGKDLEEWAAVERIPRRFWKRPD